MESIKELNLRMDRVTVENMDWQKCLNTYDRPTSFFFLDPPYTDCQAGMYASWTITDVQILKQRVDKLKGRWLLTLNDSPPIRRIFSDCKIQSISRAKGIGGKGVPYKEIIVSPS